MCRECWRGGRRCPGDTNEARNAGRAANRLKKAVEEHDGDDAWESRKVTKSLTTYAANVEAKDALVAREMPDRFARVRAAIADYFARLAESRPTPREIGLSRPAMSRRSIAGPSLARDTASTARAARPTEAEVDELMGIFEGGPMAFLLGDGAAAESRGEGEASVLGGDPGEERVPTEAEVDELMGIFEGGPMAFLLGDGAAGPRTGAHERSAARQSSHGASRGGAARMSGAAAQGVFNALVGVSDSIVDALTPRPGASRGGGSSGGRPAPEPLRDFGRTYVRRRLTEDVPPHAVHDLLDEARQQDMSVADLWQQIGTGDPLPLPPADGKPAAVRAWWDETGSRLNTAFIGWLQRG